MSYLINHIMTAPQDTQASKPANPFSEAVDVRPIEVESIEQSTFNLLVRAAARLEGELNRVLRPLDLTSATYNILAVLRAAGGSGRSCGDISEQLIAQVPDMTRLLDRLDRLGYIVRERSAADRRIVKVTITETGLGVLERLKGAVGDCYVRQLGHLGAEKLSALRDLLSVINRSVGRPITGARASQASRGH